jgi:hypothetical protein
MTRAHCLIVIACLVCGACGRDVPAVHAPDGNWIALFDGKTLHGWTPKISGHAAGDNFANTFRVDDGLLTVSYEGYTNFGAQFGSLYFDTPYSRYWLRAEYRFVGEQAPGAPDWGFRDSGIQLHSQSPQSMRDDQAFPVSVEFNLIGGRRFGKRPNGNVCLTGVHALLNGAQLTQKCATTSDVTTRGEDWVTVEVEVLGSESIRHIVNGTVVAIYGQLRLDESDPDARRLLATGASTELKQGFISLQSNGHPIQFRKIELLPLDGAASDTPKL